MHRRENFSSSVLFEITESSSLDRDLSRLRVSEAEEDSGKGNKKTAQHETKIILILCIANWKNSFSSKRISLGGWAWWGWQGWCWAGVRAGGVSAGCGGAWGLGPKSRVQRMCPSPLEVYTDDNLQWHFTCGFNFRHTLRSPFVAAFAVLKELIIRVL